jgi:peptidoglycan/LPS O-acetylase OafA/YrhL
MLKALTGIRFFAAFYVVLHHSRLSGMLTEHGHRFAGYFLAKGYFAVTIFFVLSGFILAYTYQGQVEKQGSYRRFWEARFARLWPAYILSILAAIAVYGTAQHFVPLAAAFFMVQAWNPFDRAMAGAGNSVCWSLSAEAFFYLLFPPIQSWLERRGIRGLQVGLFSMLAVCVAINSGIHSLGYPDTGFELWIPLPVIHTSEFLVGVCLGNLYLQQREQLQTKRTFGAWTYLSIALSIVALCTPNNRWTTVAIIPLCALIYALAWENTFISRLLSTPLLLLGGGISYSVYLFQLAVKEFTVRMADVFHIGSTTLRMLAVFPLLLLLAYIVFRWVEEPARRAIRGFFARRESVPAERVLIVPGSSL